MQLTRQISHVIGLVGASVLMPSIAWAAGTSVPDRIDGFRIRQIVSDSVMVEIAGFIDRFGVIATTTGFSLALFAPVLVLAVFAGLRDIGEQTSNRATRTRPDNVFKFERRVRSPKRMPSRTNEFRNVSLKTVGVMPGVVIFSDAGMQYDTQKTAAWYRARSQGMVYNGENRHVFTTRRDGKITIDANPGQTIINTA